MRDLIKLPVWFTAVWAFNLDHKKFVNEQEKLQ